MPLYVRLKLSAWPDEAFRCFKIDPMREKSALALVTQIEEEVLLRLMNEAMGELAMKIEAVAGSGRTQLRTPADAV